MATTYQFFPHCIDLEISTSIGDLSKSIPATYRVITKYVVAGRTGEAKAVEITVPAFSLPDAPFFGNRITGDGQETITIGSKHPFFRHVLAAAMTYEAEQLDEMAQAATRPSDKFRAESRAEDFRLYLKRMSGDNTTTAAEFAAACNAASKERAQKETAEQARQAKRAAVKTDFNPWAALLAAYEAAQAEEIA